MCIRKIVLYIVFGNTNSILFGYGPKRNFDNVAENCYIFAEND
jgi:hypothetical protein